VTNRWESSGKGVKKMGSVLIWHSCACNCRPAGAKLGHYQKMRAAAGWLLPETASLRLPCSPGALPCFPEFAVDRNGQGQEGGGRGVPAQALDDRLRGTQEREDVRPRLEDETARLTTHHLVRRLSSLLACLRTIFQLLLQTRRAYTMREFCLGMRAQVGFQLLPEEVADKFSDSCRST